MKNFLIILFVVLTLGALIFYFFIRDDDSTFSPWLLVPQQSALVIESQNPSNAWSQFLDSKVGAGYKQTELFRRTDNFFNTLDTLSGTEDTAEKLLSSSLHICIIPTARDQFELLYILPVKALEAQNILEDINASIENKASIIHTSRKYLDKTIFETSGDGNVQLAYIFFKNHLIASKSALLVEMVVRQINNDYKQNFKASNPKLFDVLLLDGDAGNLYINFSQLGRLFQAFTDVNKSSFFQPLTELNGGAALDLSFAERTVVLNGFSLMYDSLDLFPQFHDQAAGKPEVVNFVPRSTQYLYSYRFSDPEKVVLNNDVERWIGKDISYLELPTLKGSGASSILFAESRDPATALNYFNLEAEKAAKEDTVYREYYSGYPITEIAEQKWPGQFFANVYKPFSPAFFTMINNYAVFSNNIEALKVLIEDIENENTWGKSLDIRQYLNLGLEESNFNLIVHPENYWQQLDAQLNTTWMDEIKSNERFLKGFVLNMIQLSRIEDQYYTSVILPYEPQEVLSEGDRNLKVRFTNNFTYELATRPFVVKNHNNNLFEILVQDERRNLSLLDWEGDKLWTDSIGEVISSDIFQVDYYKNDKLQYLFAGGNRIFLLDRNGDRVEDYPLAVGKNPISWINVVDYDKSKNYRFLVADMQGSLYMMDKHGTLLDGWTPKALQGALSSRPFHVRVRAKDYIIAVQQRGTLHVMNRRGENYPGFPLELDGRISGDIFLQKGTDASSSTITVVTEQGQLVQVNLNGTRLQTENLYRPTREAKFYLIPEAQNNGYIIAREGLSRVSILDEKGNRRFEKDYLSLDPLNIQYYNFGSDKEIIAITDRDQQFTYLYNGQGDLINNQPINSAEPVAILYFSGNKQFHILKSYDNSLTALTF